MRKFIFTLVACALFFVASCSNSKTVSEAVDTVDSVEVIDTVAVDTVVADTVITE